MEFKKHIESCRGNQTVAVLCLCMVLFFNQAVKSQEESLVQVDVLAKAASSWDESVLPHYPDGDPEITILRIVIPPKVKLPLHLHPVINAGFMVKGELTVETEDKKLLHLKAGEAIIEVVNKWHFGKNEGEVPAEIIVFYAGTRGSPITEKN